MKIKAVSVVPGAGPHDIGQEFGSSVAAFLASQRAQCKLHVMQVVQALFKQNPSWGINTIYC